MTAAISNEPLSSGTFYRYSLYGTDFYSDLKLALPPGGGNGDVLFSLQAQRASVAADGDDPLVQEEHEEWFTLRAFQSGALEIEWGDWLAFRFEAGGRQVTYDLREDSHVAGFEAYAANFAASTALLLQGEETLHATVVYIDGKGIGLLGNSGAGKSTFTAYLLGQGGELVTDDLLRITQHDGSLYAEPGQPRLKLFADSAERHFPQKIATGRWNPLSEKYLFDVDDPEKPRNRRRLDCLFWLSPPAATNSDGIDLVRLAGLELFQTLSGSSMNSRLHVRTRLEQQFCFARWVAECVPVYRLHYPRRENIFPELLDVVLKGAV